jgi:uncharacterized glyoxalase superfamily protein PhnB
MAVLKMAEGHHTITPYMIVPGAAAMIGFMEKVFGAQVKLIVPRGEGVIMHAEVLIGNSVVMIADTTPQFSTVNAMLYIYVADTDATYTQALAAGAASVRQPQNEAYGARSAGITDPWGNTWWLATLLG